MIGLNLKQAKAAFFDRARIVRATTDATRRVLSRAGAFVMTSARSLIRSAKGWDDFSKPGRPPKSHLGLLKRFIFFGYDESRRSVIVGPARLGNKKGDAPSLLEFGGDATRRNRRAKQDTVAHYEPRPFMGPALQKNLERFPSLFHDSIK